MHGGLVIAAGVAVGQLQVVNGQLPRGDDEGAPDADPAPIRRALDRIGSVGSLSWLLHGSNARSAEQVAGRSTGSTQLMAVTKGVDAERVAAAIDAGCRLFGENRVQELEAKRAAVAALRPAVACQWVLIGPLQSNKVRRSLAVADRIATVGSIDLLERIVTISKYEGSRVEVALQVNVDDDPAKFCNGIRERAMVAVAVSRFHQDHVGARLHGTSRQPCIEPRRCLRCRSGVMSDTPQVLLAESERSRTVNSKEAGQQLDDCGQPVRTG